MKKIIMLLLVVLLFSSCTKTPEEQVADIYETGIEQINDFQLKTADSTFKTIFEIFPNSALGLLGIAKTEETGLQFYDAIQHYLMVLDRSTDYQEAFDGLYNCYKNLGFYDEALETAVHYNKIWHTNTHTKYLLGEAYTNLRQFQRAETYFRQAVMSGYEHKDAAQFMLANVLLQQGLRSDASTAEQEALAYDSDNPLYYSAAAEYYETLGLIDSSMSFNRKIINDDYVNINDAFIAFSRAFKNHYLADARHIKHVLEDSHAAPSTLAGLDFYYYVFLKNKSLTKASAQAFRFVYPNSISGIMYELEALGEMKENQTMRQSLQVVTIERSRGVYSQEFGEFYNYAMFMLSVRYSKVPATLNEFEAISGLRRNRIEYKLEYALTKHLVGLFDECYESLENLENGHGREANWLTGIADVWGNPGVRKYDKAEEVYEKAIKVDPIYRPAFENYLKLLLRLGKIQKTLEVYNKFPEIEKQNKIIALEKTKYLFLNKKFEEGLKQFKTNIQYASGDIVLIHELVSILNANKRTDDVKTILSLLDSHNPDIKVLFIEQAQRNRDFEKSLTYISELTEVEPENVDAKIFKARALYYTGKKTEAYDMFEQNIKDLGRNPRNLLYYSQVLAEEGFDFEKAANLARGAVFEGFGYYEYIINLADIYYRMGRYDLCRGEAIKSTLAEPENPYPYYRLGMACIKSKDKDRWQEEGIEKLKKAIELGLEGDLLTDAKNTLNSL